VSGINVYQTEEGKIAAEWEQMDSVGMLRQLGMGG
jgi:predicted ester cyclase